MRVARLFLFADWPEKNFSGQSEGGISNASGTRSVTVSAQGLSRSCCKLSPNENPVVPTSCPWVSEDATSRTGRKTIRGKHAIEVEFCARFLLDENSPWLDLYLAAVLRQNSTV